MGGTRSSGAVGAGVGGVIQPSTPARELPSQQLETDVHGIRELYWWLQGEELSEEELRQRVQIFDEVVRNVPPEALEGLNRFAFTEQNLWIGSTYIGPNKDRRYVQDELTIEMKQFREMTHRPPMSLVYEEVGHRMQLKSHVPLYKQFKREVPLGDRAVRDFLGLTEEQIRRRVGAMELPRSEVIAGEMFAKSFGYLKAGAEVPSQIRQWWEKTGLI